VVGKMGVQADLRWINDIWETVPKFLKTIADPNRIGSFLPCVHGVTDIGKKISLGYSCFGLKTYYMLGLWEELSDSDRQDWENYIKSFQLNNYKKWPISQFAFIDPFLLEWTITHLTIRDHLSILLHREDGTRGPKRIIISETKQSIASLDQIGVIAERPYQGFPTDLKSLNKLLRVFNWQRPWGTGGVFAALSLFLSHEGSRQMEDATLRKLLNLCQQNIQSIADPETGCYYSGKTPDYSQLINGAMKVLTALDWLETPIHYPEKLIDTCLSKKPISEGCHLVDIIYVLYRCTLETDYKRIQVQEYCIEILPLIKKHYNSDGGFSYYIEMAQTNYYGVPITNGLPESDIHGTCLLIWALTMTAFILEMDNMKYNIIRP